MANESESVESLDCMDVDDGDEGDKFQSVNKLLEYVPYSGSIGKEADFYHNKLRENLSKAVGSHNLQLATATYTKSLQS